MLVVDRMCRPFEVFSPFVLYRFLIEASNGHDVYLLLV